MNQTVKLCMGLLSALVKPVAREAAEVGGEAIAKGAKTTGAEVAGNTAHTAAREAEEA